MGGNMGLVPTKQCIQRMQEAFPKNAEVELVFMDDVYRTMPAGLKGKVICIDSRGTIHVAWENGSSLGAVWNADVIKNSKTGVRSNDFWADNRPVASL